MCLHISPRVPCVIKTCSPANVPCVLTCSHANVPCMLTCQRALSTYVLWEKPGKMCNIYRYRSYTQTCPAFSSSPVLIQRH